MRSFTPTASWSRVRRSPSRTTPASPSTPTSAPSSRRRQAGDTIASVVKNSDGSGYLLMQSGDALHFTGSMEVKCTAYTTGYDGVGTRTATGTTVAHGCVAVDKSVIPLGTTMFITSGSYTYGMAHAGGYRRAGREDRPVHGYLRRVHPVRAAQFRRLFSRLRA